MKRFSKPMTDLSPLKALPVEVPIVSEISIQRLIDDCLGILYREVRNLSTLSARGKLEAPDARDLRDHLKLLFELKTREDATLSGLTDEQIQAMLHKPNTVEES